VTVPPVAPSGPAGNETSTTPTQPTESGPPAERHKGKVTLNYDYVIDLDSQAGDWDIENVGVAGGSAEPDLYLQFKLGVQVDIVKLTPAADYFDCANSTGRETEIDAEALFKGDAYCVETNEGRWARLIIVSKETATDGTPTVTMDVVVWEKGGA
jgi:hypothetical protein